MEYTEHNPLRVFTSFSGYDSQCMALDRLKEMHPQAHAEGSFPSDKRERIRH